VHTSPCWQAGGEWGGVCDVLPAEYAHQYAPEEWPYYGEAGDAGFYEVKEGYDGYGYPAQQQVSVSDRPCVRLSVGLLGRCTRSRWPSTVDDNHG
jgi:hypothetical protein